MQAWRIPYRKGHVHGCMTRSTRRCLDHWAKTWYSDLCIFPRCLCGSCSRSWDIFCRPLNSMQLYLPSWNQPHSLAVSSQQISISQMLQLLLLQCSQVPVKRPVLMMSMPPTGGRGFVHCTAQIQRFQSNFGIAWQYEMESKFVLPLVRGGSLRYPASMILYHTTCHVKGRTRKWILKSDQFLLCRILRISRGLWGFPGPLKSACLQASSICRFEIPGIISCNWLLLKALTNNDSICKRVCLLSANL